MKLNIKYRFYCLQLFVASFLLYSCSENETPISETTNDQARLSFLIKTASADKVLVTGDEGRFSSLALYIFNKESQQREYSELIPEFTPQKLQEYSRSVNVSPQTKIIYAIANYNDPDKVFSTPVTTDLTLQQLENLTATSNTLTDSNLLMIGKKEVQVNSANVVAEVPLERLVARVDIYMFKNQELASSNVVVTSIKLINQVLNTNCVLEDVSMPAPITLRNANHLILGGDGLQLMPSDLSGITPDKAHASFYTYRNMAPNGKEDASAPYLLITASLDGTNRTYKGYLTDQGQTINKYSLLHNTVYRVIAMLDHPDNYLTIKTTPYPWEVAYSEIGQALTDGDYQLEPYNGSDTGATTGIVQFPYIKNGEARDETSYASYNFSLTAPAGAVWTATLTNGLDFTFGSNGSVDGTQTVSKGIARKEPYEIKIGATKPWSGTSKSTYFYITVGGVKLKINPKQSNDARQFPGDNDTDILIRQTEYK